MTDQVQPDHGVEFAFGIGTRSDGVVCVSMSVTTCGITTTGIALDPDMAEALAPELAKELINAARAAKAEARKADGLLVIPGLPDSLRK